MKIFLLLVLSSVLLLSGCISTGCQRNYIISNVSPEEEISVFLEESPE